MIRQILSGAAFAVFSLTAPLMAQDSNPVVIELFTSQGCSSCPPADALLLEYGDRDDVITLALHVDYWDYIGWPDTFARPEHTDRQRAYASAAHKRMIYTPQMILNGETSIVGNQPDDLTLAISNHLARQPLVSLHVQLHGADLQISAQNLGYDSADGDLIVQIMRYIPEETVEIRRGENAGKSISYGSVVTGMDVLTRWDGQSDLRFSTDVSSDDLFVVLVQEDNHGPVLAAARLR